MRLHAIALVAFAGCFKPLLTEHLPCAAPDNWCPSPQTCIQGVCEGVGVDGGDDAAVAPANFVFTTSTTFLPGTRSTAELLDAADAQCNALGQKLRQGTYMAWLGTDVNDAAARIAARTSGSPGWVRPDGKPFTRSLADLVAGTIYYPPRIDDNKADVVAVNLQTTVATELDPTGCEAGGATVRIGFATGDDPTWRSFDVRSCGSDVWLYCFETDLATAVDPPVFDPSLALGFVTASTYPIAAGISALDGDCQAEGNAAGYSSRQFKALVATSTANARSRFAAAIKPWTRVDGVVFAPMSLGKFDAPLSLTPMPSHLVSLAAVGAHDLTTTANSNCLDWSSQAQSASAGDTTLSDDLGFQRSGIDCNATGHLYCLEAP